jgi:hypothetical protein
MIRAQSSLRENADLRKTAGNEGLWFDMSGKGTYKFYIPDIETQQIAELEIGQDRKSALGCRLGSLH